VLNKEKISILIVDDQVLFADNLKLMLENVAEDIEVVGIAFNGEEAITLVDKYLPDIILMDVRMPVLDGVNATKIIREKYPHQKIVMLTTFVDDIYVQKALYYGAVGYLLKTLNHEELIASLRAVHKGSILLSPDLIKNILISSESAESGNDNSEWKEALQKMGKREREILKLVAKGYDNTEIAEELFISNQTVRNYISAIYAKVGSKNRLEVVSIAKKIVPEL